MYDFGSRFYNPILGRWFNLDPRMQFGSPYLYCGNSPMMYVDPDGELGFLAAFLVGAMISGATYTASTGFENWDFGNFMQSMFWGGISGMATAGIGTMWGSQGTLLGREVLRGVTNGIAQGGISALQGGNFMSSFATGGLGSFAGSAFQKIPGIGASKAGMYAFSGVSAGVTAEATGGNFWKGAGLGIMSTGLNHLAENLKFFEDQEEGFRAMGDYSDESGNEIAGNYATKKDGTKGMLVSYDKRNSFDNSYFDYHETSTGERYEQDGIGRKYVLGDDQYHTHLTESQMTTPSAHDIKATETWKNVRILYNNRVWNLNNDPYKGWQYERTKIKY